ncbi:hypothetical protein TcasGA2_TC031330 [Tribolium castaneum]|uniref:Uncharacterized protein n=1 Tax=Tribolium castaneum TaxID=7070 RepID=A0A139WB71_TRICA|nr:hypothetical protein TcasGA2_TC031330 [Tribolium castaneum]
MAHIVKAVVLVALLMTVIDTSEGAPFLLTKLLIKKALKKLDFLNPEKLMEMMQGGGQMGGAGGGGSGSAQMSGQKPPQSGGGQKH